MISMEKLLISIIILATFISVVGTLILHNENQSQTNEEWRKNQICDLINLSDQTLLECAFEAETNQQKTTCYSSVKELDKQVVELQTAFKGSFGEYPICD